MAYSLKGYIQVVAASVLYGSIGIFIRLIGNIPLGSIIFYRLLFGLIAMALYLSLCGRFNEIRLKENKRYIFMLGLFEAGAVLTYFYSVRYTTVSMAVLLLYTSPIYVTLLSPLLLRENIMLHSIFALILSISGVILVIRPDSLAESMDTIGVTFGLIAGLLYALTILISRTLRDHYTGTAQATWSMAVSIILFFPYSRAVSPAVLLDNLYLLILFGLIPTALGGVLYFNGLGLIRAQSASIISLLEPVSAVFFALVILNEPVHLTTLLGGGLILAGALLTGREGPPWSVRK